MALRTPDEEPNKDVYDDDKPSWRDPGAIGNLERSFGAPSATDKDLPEGHPDKTSSGNKGMGSDLLGAAEEKGSSGVGQVANDVIGGGFKTTAGGFRQRLSASLAGSRRKKALIGGGAVGGVMAIFVAAFLALVPLKIVGMMDNLRSHFFSTSESAVSKQTDNLFSHYVQKHVLPGMRAKHCSSTKVDKDCVADIPGATRAQKLYQGWKDARLENKLAQDYGIAFELHGTSYTMTVPGEKATSLDDLTKPGNTKTLSDLSTSQVRAKYREALEGETFYKKTLYRFKVGKLLERKYGIKRCVVACDTKDTFADWKSAKNQAFKSFLADRVLAPNSEGKALILQCVLGGGCDNPDGEGVNGEKRDNYQKQLSEKLAAYQEKFGAKATKQVIEDANVILDKGWAPYIAQKVINAIAQDGAGAAGEAAANITEDAVPVIGWIDSGAKLVDTSANAGGKLKKWAFIANSTAMVSLYQMYRTHADEIKSGHVNADLVGSFSSALDVNQKKMDNKGTMGGGAAEDSPLYASLFGDSKPSNNTAFLDGGFSGKASAASSEPCDNGLPIPAGKVLCPEESLVTSNLLTSFSSLFDSGPLALLKAAAHGEQQTLGKVSGLVGTIASDTLAKLPWYKNAVDAIGGIIQPLIDSVTQKLLPSPISDNMSGHRNFDMIAGGADVAANSFAETGLGGQKLTNGQVAEIRNDETTTAELQFKSQPFFARMFDTTSRFSLLSRVAMAMPTSANTALKSSTASLINNPLATITHSLAMVLSPSHVFAADPPADDPFGAPQAGYALNNPVFTTDPEKYTDDYCKNLTDAWNAATTVDPGTGMDVHTTTNPCLLNNAAIGAAGAMFTDAVLDPGDTNTPSGASTADSGGATGMLAPGALSWPVDLKGSNITQCAGNVGANGLIVSGHPGVDISQATGTPVYASADGKVVFAGNTDQNGPAYGPNYVVIQHNNGFSTGYGHMSSMSVKEGDTVTQGQQIGKVGSLGHSTGPHLHYNVKRGGWTGWDNNNVDPFKNGLKIPDGAPNSAGCHN